MTEQFLEQLKTFEARVDCDDKGKVTMKQTGEWIGAISEWKDGASLSVKCKKHGCAHMIEQTPGVPMYSRIKAWLGAWDEGAICYEKLDHERMWVKLFPTKPKPKSKAKAKPKGEAKAAAAKAKPLPKCNLEDPGY